MNLDLHLCARILQEQDFEAIAAAGLAADAFIGSGKGVFEFISKFYLKHGGLPSFTTVREETEALLPDAPEPLGFYIDKMQRRFQEQAVAKGLREARECLEKENADEAIEKLHLMLSRVGEVNAGQRQVMDVREMVDDFLTEYQRVKHMDGPDGMLTPWKFLNEATWGLHPGELWVIAARMGTGKTWWLLKLLEKMWLDERRCLFVSQEMGLRTVVRRLLCVAGRYSYGEVKRGRLPTMVEQAMQEFVYKLRDGATPFTMVPPGRAKTVTDIELLIRERRPEIVVIDSFYLMKNPGSKSKWEAVTEITGDLKQLAEAQGVPIVASTQVNREGAKSARGGVGRVGTDMLSFGDAIAYNADAVILLEQDQDMREAKEIQLRFLKSRDDEGALKWVTEFDLDAMSFEPKGERIDAPEDDGQSTLGEAGLISF